MSSEASPTTASSPTEVIRCGICGAENLARATRCRECDAHLYVVCRACGTANLRGPRDCTACGTRLGGSRWRRKLRRWRRRFDLVAFTVIFLGILAAVWYLYTNTQRPTVPPPTEAPIIPSDDE